MGKNITNSLIANPYPDHKKQQGKFIMIETGFKTDLSFVFIHFNIISIGVIAAKHYTIELEKPKISVESSLIMKY